MNTNEKTFPPILSEEEDKKEDLYFQRQDWLKEHGRTESDIMLDDKGQLIYVEGEEGNEKVYLPESLQNITF